MQRCLARIIRDRSHKTVVAVALAAAMAAWCVEGLHLGAATDPLEDLKAGASALDAKNYAAAAASLKGLGKRLPKLADYVGWLEASSQFGLKNYAGVEAALDPVWKQTPASPLTVKADMLAAQAFLQNGSAQRAVDLLRKNYAVLPQPQGDLALAQAFSAAGDAVNAAVYDQRAYYGYPNSAEAASALADMARLQAAMGDKYPPSLPSAMLGRALKLLESKQTEKARKELEALVPQLGGAERDTARVSIAVADYDAQDTAAARRELAALENLAPEADAERLYYLLLCDRRLNNLEQVDESVDRLGRLYPASPWRLQALLSAANRYLTENRMDAYEPLYRACYESFPKDSEAPGCHWKVAWGHYIRRRADAADLLRAHLRLFPAADSASAALYFLGRLAEDARDASGAQTYFNEVAREYPNQYYATLARDRLTKITAASPSMTAASPSAPVTEFLHSIAFPKRARAESFKPGPESSVRIERAKLLQQAGLPDWAEQELRFAARNGDQPYVMAMQLASLSAAKPDQAMRFIKAFAGGYLFVPLEAAPRDFWTFAFPLPFRTEVENLSKQNGLDPFLTAALIRQESEFDPKAVSKTGARGLAQIQPATGQDLSRRLKLAGYSAAALFQPHVNLELGTYYLKTLLAAVGGRQEAALASYDAGLTHARAWLTWGDFREPAEFIETIPFTETHSYVQGVLRNADVYRRLYQEKPEHKVQP
ncbi:MAG TPA: transglycosylase SLT domain-containing protein [Bryobacteraceae bacterium]